MPRKNRTCRRKRLQQGGDLPNQNIAGEIDNIMKYMQMPITSEEADALLEEFNSYSGGSRRNKQRGGGGGGEDEDEDEDKDKEIANLRAQLVGTSKELLKILRTPGTPLADKRAAITRVIKFCNDTIRAIKTKYDEYRRVNNIVTKNRTILLTYPRIRQMVEMAAVFTRIKNGLIEILSRLLPV